jgi:MFS family permease
LRLTAPCPRVIGPGHKPYSDCSLPALSTARATCLWLPRRTRLLLVAVRGFSMAAAGGVLAVYALGSMVCQVTGGWLADALSRRPS